MEKTHNKMHLTFHQRKTIEIMLNENYKLKAIADEIEKDERTVSKEIRRHLTIIPSRKLSLKQQIERDDKKCKRLLRFPYCCNGCASRIYCASTHLFYYSNEAQKIYEKVLQSSRLGIKMPQKQFEEMDEIIRDGVYRGMSPYSIYSCYPEYFGCSLKTVYNYINSGTLQITKTDLRRKGKLKVKKVYSKRKINDNSKILAGRRLEDYFYFIANNNVFCPVQIDTVIGSKNSQQCFLTIHFTAFHLMLIYLLSEKTSAEVALVFDRIQRKIGIENFKKLFPCILTDRGCEFSNPESIEFDEDTGELRTRVFYCDAYVSNQKAQIESNHRFIRYIVPKGSYLDNLDDQDALKITSHIASYPRKELGGSTPYYMFSKFYPDILRKLKIEKVNPKVINLTPTLLHHK